MTEDKRSIIQMVAGLIEQGKKNQDKIAYSKILDTFSGVEISSEQFDNILKVLEDNKIEVLRSKNDMEQTVSLSAKEKEPDEVDDEELEESKILLDIDDDIEEDSEVRRRHRLFCIVQSLVPSIVSWHIFLRRPREICRHGWLRFRFV